ncbi:4Fe-4S binding protein [Lachnospiraceae bacterium OttesenSCG-928-E19]|nr:4Fe-4S binding protein [Lachnospiraceae bacterium OttesenSCG-928-E19]
MVYKIDPSKCIACGTCAGVCPVMAIAPANGKYAIDPAKCISCGTCAAVCPVGAIAVDMPAPAAPKA